jgi:diguanylate cyclase (GGDEF)-like protein
LEVNLFPTIFDLSLFAHVIQTLGILLICFLFGGLFWISPRRYFSYWVKAWYALFVAMLCLQIHFRFHPHLNWLQYVYFVGGYCFAFYLWAGLVSFPNKRLPFWINSRIVFAILALWSLVLMFIDQSFANRFTLHAFVFALSLIPATIAVSRLRLSPDQNWARYFALVSLITLSVLFMANALNLLTEKWIGPEAYAIYIAYQSVFDVLVEMLLAFGLIVIAAVNAQSRLKRSHHLLQKERDKMALLAHKDPLTDCFNRHALNKMTSRFNRDSGLLVMIDINNLKQINDNYGHQEGDQAIRKVALTLKDFLRSDDYLFRLGGDEFLLASFGLTKSSGQERMQAIQTLLLNDEDNNTPIKVSVSWGMEEFGRELKFEQVMSSADKELYSHKVANRAVV